MSEERRPPSRQRRALSPARKPAPISTWGHVSMADGMARALDVSRVNEAGIRAYTHGFHTYPARMHPHTARRALAALDVQAGDRVVDPFCGAGTVLVEAVLAGGVASGVDANPLAILVAHARTWAAPSTARRALAQKARAIAGAVIAEGKAARRADHEEQPLRGNLKRGKKLEGWFAPHVRRELEALAKAVDEVKDGEQREILRAVLSSILVKVSRRTSDTKVERIERTIGRGFAARFFADRADELMRGLDALWKEAPARTPPPTITLGDARKLTGIADGSVAAVVTSPPYAGTYDYHEHHELRLAFLGMADAPFAEAEIGARRAFTGSEQRVAAGIAAWEKDLGQAFTEVSRILKWGGYAAVLVGDSLAGAGVAAIAVHAEQSFKRIAQVAKLNLVGGASMRRAPIGTVEINAFRAAPKQEHLILLKKGA